MAYSLMRTRSSTSMLSGLSGASTDVFITQLICGSRSGMWCTSRFSSASAASESVLRSASVLATASA